MTPNISYRGVLIIPLICQFDVPPGQGSARWGAGGFIVLGNNERGFIVKGRYESSERKAEALSIGYAKQWIDHWLNG